MGFARSPPPVRPPTGAASTEADHPSSAPRAARHRLTALELSLTTTSLEALERTTRELDPKTAHGELAGLDGIAEGAVLRTCHRVELYLWSTKPVETARLLRSLGLDSDGWRLHQDRAAVLHLFRVASGLESMAVGEREVRDQVRAAVRGIASRHPRPVLRTLFLEAVATAEELAPDVPSSRSIAALAATRLLEESASPFPRVLVVGSGVVGRKLAEILAPVGRVTILYRTRAPEDGFLRQTGCRAAAWDRLAEEVAVADAVVTAAKSGGQFIDSATIAGRSRPLLLIDLGVPRNIAPEVKAAPAVRLLDLEELRPRSPAEVPAEVEEAVAQRAEAAYVDLEARGFEAAIDAYRREAERIRRGLLDEVRGAFPHLTAEQEAALERLTRKLADRLLLGPTQGLRSLPSGPHAEELRRWALEVLRLDGSRL